MAKRPEALNWCFTLNNPSKDDEDSLVDTLPYQYLIFQYEMGEGETMHMQGYFVLQRKMRLTALKKLLPTAHFEIRQGTHEEAKRYCCKADTRQDGPYEYGSEKGIAKKKGQRTDILKLKADIDAGKTYEEIADDNFGNWLRYEKGIRSYRNLKTKDRKFEQGEKPKIIIYWGPSGTGKSSRVMKEYPNAYWLTKPQVQTAEVLWQDYEGQEVVVFDEFYSWIQYDKLLRICDYYPEKVRMLYGSAKLQAKTFVFTSNQNPDLWYDKVKDKSAWNRRLQEFGHIEFMGEKYNFGIDQTESTEQGYISEEL